MSSSHGDKRISDVEMGEATSPATIPTSPVEAPACVADHLSFREKLVRRQAEKEQVRAGAELPSSSALAVAPGHGTEGVTPRDTGTLAGLVVPDASALPAGSSTTPILVEDKERAADSMPPPPARKEIVLALRAPSVVPVTQPKGRKRKFTKGGDGESSQQGGLSIASGLRGKFVSLIDGMISECGSETSRLAGELLELQGRWSETKAMLTAVKDSHSVKVSKLEVAIGELERDLGKTVSSLLKEKETRKAKSSEVRRLQRQIEGDAGLIDRAVYRLDPRMSGLELRPDPRPDARTDRTEARLSRPTRQAKTDSQARLDLDHARLEKDNARLEKDHARLDLDHEVSQNDRDFSLLARLAHTARTGDHTDGLIDPFDQFMHFDQPNLTKAKIFHLSEDIGRTWSSLVHDPDMVVHTDSPTSVILLTAVHASGYNESGQKPNSHLV
ncbi:hypothetical protein F2Q68_00038849 [Brassica cretica]|uniref:Uncharacterized protein n=1 Tax=Brassica cretica TaxID=69181 RepID=A0A8S9MHS9_BRACR|nr:hypothetical protein F2Q68_00038849 [Brassica cretica]